MRRDLALAVLALLVLSVQVSALDVAKVPRPVVKASYSEPVRVNYAFIKSEKGATFPVNVQPSGYNETFRFQPLDLLRNGNYTLTVNASDRVNNSRVDDYEFLVDVPFQVYLLEPSFGVAPTPVYTVRLETSVEAHCSYSLIEVGDVNSGTYLDGEDSSFYDRLHELAGVSFNNQEVWFKCESRNGSQVKKGVTFRVDASKPVITVKATPNPVVDPARRQSVLNITSDDYAACSVNGEDLGDPSLESSYKKSHSKSLDYSNIYDSDRHEFNYTATCTNKADLPATSNYTL